MKNQSLSYVLTGFAPDTLDKNFIKAKNHFGLFINQPLTSKKGIITKNHAHLTLQRPFTLRPDISEQEVVQALEKVSFNKLLIRSQSYAVFQTENHGNVLVALAEQTEALTQLHSKIDTALRDLITESASEKLYGFTPHITILYRVPDDLLMETIEYAKERIIPFSFTLQTMTLLRQVPQIIGERVVAREFPSTSA